LTEILFVIFDNLFNENKDIQKRVFEAVKIIQHPLFFEISNNSKIIDKVKIIITKDDKKYKFQF
jgi:hypothetical protein